MAFQIRRGLEADLPASPLDGELLYSTDTNKLYVGFGGTANAVTSTGLSLTGLSVTDVGGDGSLTYNNTTGVFTYTGPSATEVRAHFSAGTGISITNGAIASTITQYTDALARAAVSAGTGLSYDSSTGVISIEQAVGTTSNVTFNDLTVSGNLTVQGTTTTVNSTTINLADNIITLNSNATGSASQNAGIEVERGDDANVSIRWNETSNAWQITNDGTTYNNISSFSGNYADLTGTPTLATVATSGSYTDLTGTPTLATVATSGSYTDLTGTPTLATVATSGSYDDLTNKPTLTTNLDGLTDVVITSATVGQVLKYDGTNWINDTDATGGGGGGGTATNGWTYSASGATGNNFLLGTDYNDTALTLPNASNPPTSNYDGNKNTLIGHKIGSYITTGYRNTMIGNCVGNSITTGYYNTLIGAYVGVEITTGYYNTMIGPYAGVNATTGSYNTWIGAYAGRQFTNDYTHVVGGPVTPISETVGIGTKVYTGAPCSVAIGPFSSTERCGNVSVGYSAAGRYYTNESSTKGQIAIGHYALASNGHGISIGLCAGRSPGFAQGNLLGYNNILIGAYTGRNLSASCRNGASTFIGTCAGYCSLAHGMIAIGQYAACKSSGPLINADGWYNSQVIIGTYAAKDMTNAIHNHIIRTNTDWNTFPLTTGSYNTIMGACSARWLTSGGDNIFLGFGSGARFNTQGNNIHIGGVGNIGGDINSQRTFSASSAYNVAIGPLTLRYAGNSSGTCYHFCDNTILGPSSGQCLARTADTAYNVIIGSNAGNNITGGLNNIAIGNFAGPQTANTVTCNTIWMGNSSITNANIQVAWTVTSDVRDKCVIGPVTRGKDFLRNINPIEYTFKDRNTDSVYDLKKRYGFSANELLDLEGSDPVIVTDHDPDKLRITTDYLVPVLVNAIKELSDSIDSLNSRLEVLENNS
jgi:hypothetical protein